VNSTSEKGGLGLTRKQVSPPRISAQQNVYGRSGNIETVEKMHAICKLDADIIKILEKVIF
jgi:hypothetical protein